MNAKKIVLATLGAALIAGAAIPAIAAPGHDGPGRHGPGRPGPMGREVMQDVMFVRLLKNADTDKDGKISKAEMTAFQDKMFTAIDANKDGMLTRGELLDYRQAKMEEFRKNNPPPQKPDDAKKADDANKADGQGEQKMGGRREHRMEQRADNQDGRGWGHHGGRREQAGRDRPHDRPMMRGGMFGMMDTDKDGKISKAEATAAVDKLFARMDTNKDGQITVDDLPNRPL